MVPNMIIHDARFSSGWTLILSFYNLYLNGCDATSAPLGYSQIISDPLYEGNFFPQKRWNSITGLTKMSGIPRADDQKKSWNSKTIPKKV